MSLSDASGDAAEGDFCLPGLFYGQYLWGAGGWVWETLYFLHTSFSGPQSTPGGLKSTVWTCSHFFPIAAWKYWNYNTEEAWGPSNPSWKLCSSDCSPLRRLVLEWQLWLGRAACQAALSFVGMSNRRITVAWLSGLWPAPFPPTLCTFTACWALVCVSSCGNAGEESAGWWTACLAIASWAWGC